MRFDVRVLMYMALCSVSLATVPLYDVTLKRVNQQRPLDIQSVFTLSYNPSYAPVYTSPTESIDVLFVRSQNVTKPPYEVGQSVVTASFSTSKSGKLEENISNIRLSPITNRNVVFEASGPEENYGVEDPRIVYRTKDRTYYMFYSAVEETPTSLTSRLALATTTTPLIKESWKRHGPVVTNKWSKSGALLLRDDVADSPHYLIWGDEKLSLQFPMI
ncbi:hypothetical protein GEMRC1_008971 [Eukaryota sp. GEM-RC1]